MDLGPAFEDFQASILNGVDPDAWSQFALEGALLHQDSIAEATVTFVLAREPQNALATLTSAYLVWEGLLLDRVDAEIISLQTLIERKVEVAAAALMMDRLIARKLEMSEESGVFLASPDRELMELSVSMEPEWVENNARLSRAFKAEGRIGLAHEAAQRAIDNCWGPARAGSLNAGQQAYEYAFTGRLSKPESLVGLLED